MKRASVVHHRRRGTAELATSLFKIFPFLWIKVQYSSSTQGYVT